MTHKADLFRAAHRIAKAVHVKGDCYAVTFGQGLKQARAMIKRLLTTTGELRYTLNAAQIGMLVDVDGLMLTGECHTEEGKYSEGMACFNVARMVQYVQTMFEGVTSHDLNLKVTFVDQSVINYKIVK
ncbi:hypothetical protein PJKIFABJ_00194 [Pseudomonas phage PE09]|uniref:Uncharacterized protein n=2 Tax=Otagovirus TaxID=2560197 RepID=A0A7S7YDK5_9CAUD|nr:hypothetical protein QGX22_gp060 [Pseudomonas phage PE09]YP_010768481.1 hypothetical protein QGX23_gp058 [Pseudomonas phage PN09]QHZ60130.1 hypothetical protein PJKIFABJ_00194 [Pseudomonas phage PE09]QPB10594.1 hypothetical protein PN09_173 [Pseudomonas phage PN09]